MKSIATRQTCVLIGILSQRTQGAIPTITREFMEGLRSKYNFVPHVAEREFGSSIHARFRPVNLLYFAKHLTSWTISLVQHRPDVAHYPITSYWNLEKSLLFLRVAKLMGARTVGHLHGGAFIEFWRSLPFWRKKPALAILKSMDALVVLSQGWKAKVSTEVGLAENRIHIVHNLIDHNLESALLSMPTPRRTCNVLCMGVMSQQKGMWEILEAMKVVSGHISVHADLIGPDREPGAQVQCKAWLRDNSLTSICEVRGAVWETDRKADFFQNAAIALLPSHFENLPLVVMEAAAAGLPIIATPVGALPEFFLHGTSMFFVERGNVKEIAERIEQLLGSAELRRAMGNAARKVFVETFSRDIVLASLDAVYQEVLRSDISKPVRA